MAFDFSITFLGGLLLQAIINIIKYTPAIIVALYFYKRFIKNQSTGYFQRKSINCQAKTINIRRRYEKTNTGLSTMPIVLYQFFQAL